MTHLFYSSVIAMLHIIFFYIILAPKQNVRHFAGDMFKCIFVNDIISIFTEISLKFIHNCPIDNDSSHYTDVIMGAIASHITSLTIVYSTVYSDAGQRKHQSSASLAFVWEIHRGSDNGLTINRRQAIIWIKDWTRWDPSPLLLWDPIVHTTFCWYT